MIDELAGTAAQAAWLVTAGLWSETPEGYVFIGWEKYQPTRKEVEEHRRKEADRKQKYRMSRRDTAGTEASVPQVSHEASGYPDPTRPDPIDKDHVQNESARNRRMLEEFDKWW
jgi:hypothetical protein